MKWKLEINEEGMMPLKKSKTAFVITLQWSVRHMPETLIASVRMEGTSSEIDEIPEIDGIRCGASFTPVNKSVRRVRRIWILALIYLSAPPWCPIDHDETRHQHVCGALQTARQEKYERCLGGGNTGRECTISFLMSKTF